MLRPTPLRRPLHRYLTTLALFATIGCSLPASNHLAEASSPYLRQHAENPVDWYPWGEAAFARAREENKPIFLSIGYSTCHWCHVMAAESFEDPATAALLNEHFIAIKVDREERPDIDRVYQTFVQASTGSGGWPLSVWLTPDLKPFYAGTYFPPANEGRRPGFPTLLSGLAQAWATQPDNIRAQSAQMLATLAADLTPAAATDAVAWGDLRHEALLALRDHFDPIHGGFDAGAKFPSPVNLELLLDLAGSATTPPADRDLALQLATDTLRALTAGGLQDHVGGGFHRYTVDAAWRVPHFEKMLYDQAQLVSTLLSAWQLTRDPDLRDAATATLAYVGDRLTLPGGAFASAEDADSALAGDPDQHAEGAFYTWTAAAIDALLPPDDHLLFRRAFAIRDTGNVEPVNDPQGELNGLNVLALAPDFSPSAAERTRLRTCLDILDTARARRPRPALDDKVITAWNGLMISAFARAAQVLDEPAHLATAQRAARFLRTHLYDESTGILSRSHREGRSDDAGFPEDYACLIQGLLDLYETDFDTTWLQWALRLQATQDTHFGDPEHGGYFANAATDSSIVLRMKADQDGAEPTATSVAVRNLGRLSALFHDPARLAHARTAARSLAPAATRHPLALPQLLAATGWLTGDAQQALIHAQPDDPATAPLLREVWHRFHPRRVILRIDATSRPFFEARVPFVAGLPDGPAEIPTAYICENFVCQLPVTAPTELAALLNPSSPVSARSR